MPYVPVAAQAGNPPEISGLCAVSHAVGRGGPEDPVAVAPDVVDLIVRKAQGVVRAEILVILVDVIFVEATESGYPYMAVGILRESVHSLVGKNV